jgi:hypothetical protein
MSDTTGSCPDCRKPVDEKQNSIECEACEFWFHTKCQKVSDAAFGSLSSNPSFHWYCKNCNTSVVKLFKAINSLKVGQDRIEGEIQRIDREVLELKGLKDRVNKLEVELTNVGKNAVDLIDSSALETRIQATWAENVSKNVGNQVDLKVKTMREDVEEKMEIEKRRSNVILHGVKEAGIVTVEELLTNSPDRVALDEILQEGLRLDASRHIEEVVRIGKLVPGKCRPLRVKIKSVEGRAEILRRAKELKENEKFSKVFITPDLTRKQQTSDKELRSQLKKLRDEGLENIRIKNGKIIKNLPNGQVQVVYQIGN